MSNDNVHTEKIIIDIGNKKIELTIEQAKKIKDLLDEMFNPSIPTPILPIIIERQTIPSMPYFTWCSSEATTHNQSSLESLMFFPIISCCK